MTDDHEDEVTSKYAVGGWVGGGGPSDDTVPNLFVQGCTVHGKPHPRAGDSDCDGEYIAPASAVRKGTEEELTREIAACLNRHSRENASATPDYILASYLIRCLRSYEVAIGMREEWYGFPTGFVGGPLGPVDRS